MMYEFRDVNENLTQEYIPAEALQIGSQPPDQPVVAADHAIVRDGSDEDDRKRLHCAQASAPSFASASPSSRFTVHSFCALAPIAR